MKKHDPSIQLSVYFVVFRGNKMAVWKQSNNTTRPASFATNNFLRTMKCWFFICQIKRICSLSISGFQQVSVPTDPKSLNWPCLHPQEITNEKKDNKQCLSDTPHSNGQWRKLISRIQRPYKMAKFEKQLFNKKNFFWHDTSSCTCSIYLYC